MDGPNQELDPDVHDFLEAPPTVQVLIQRAMANAAELTNHFVPRPQARRARRKRGPVRSSRRYFMYHLPQGYVMPTLSTPAGRARSSAYRRQIEDGFGGYKITCTVQCENTPDS